MSETGDAEVLKKTEHFLGGITITCTPKHPLYLVSCIGRGNVLVPTTLKAKLIPHRHLYGFIAMKSIHTLVVGGQLEVQLGSKSPTALAILLQNPNSFIKQNS